MDMEIEITENEGPLKVILTGNAAKMFLTAALKAQLDVVITPIREGKMDAFLHTEKLLAAQDAVAEYAAAQSKPAKEIKPRTRSGYPYEQSKVARVYSLVRKNFRISNTETTPQQVAGYLNIHKYDAARCLKYLTRKGYVQFVKKDKHLYYSPTTQKPTRVIRCG
jgi:hypothetical protein